MRAAIIKYFNTIRHLTAEQMFFRLYYKLRARLRGLAGRRPRFNLYRKGSRLSPKTPWIDKPNSYKGDNRFNILNVEYIFNGRWDDGVNGDLWRYNLNYMDFLLQKGLPAEEGIYWIDNFINSMPCNKLVCDPYPISLRGINWIKFVSQNYDLFTGEQLKRVDTALYSQYAVLQNSVERHLMANHYLENGFSLFFAANYFNDDALLKAAEKILYSQLNEQITDDGAHFELSPMYHCIILERLLDCYNIIDSRRCKKLSDTMAGCAKKMLAWLDAIVDVNDNIPLFNDAATEVAPLPEDIRNYAKALGLVWDKGALGDSGYRRWRTGNYEVIADMAALGPSYNLGHSHADTFSYVMSVGKEPFIVDTGISTYTANPRRLYERSTGAHNTVCINGLNSSGVWGAFRCANRADVYIINENKNSAKARHNGYKSIGVTCLREFICNDRCFEIIDEAVSENGKRVRAISGIHLAPSVKILNIDNDRIETTMGEIILTGAKSIDVDDAAVSSRYNILEPSKSISVLFEEKLRTRIIPKI